MKNKKQSETEVQKSSSGVFMKLFLIAMPLFILAVIVVFVLHIAGFNTLDWLKEQGKSIPVVGEMFIDDEEKMLAMTSRHYKISWKAKIKLLITRMNKFKVLRIPSLNWKARSTVCRMNWKKQQVLMQKKMRMESKR